MIITKAFLSGKKVQMTGKLNDLIRVVKTIVSVCRNKR